jgi:uncharacterized protein YdhG (YjbR/CyaY superfamily)
MAKKRSPAGGTAPTGRQSVRGYLAGIDEERRRRLQSIIGIFRAGVDGVVESMRSGMPTFEKDGRWVAVASQKRHLSVYFCGEDVIDAIRTHHPELDYGKACVRIRDNQHVPLFALEQAYLDAMGVRVSDHAARR